jgi:hypothetical protein
MMKALLVALVLASQATTPIFRFETDGFWLNLHHYLYVLGRVEAKMPDVMRAAVAGAPADEADGLKGLSDTDRRIWREAVSFYATGLSRQDAVFDRSLVDVTNTLRRAAADAPASTLPIDPALAATLDRAAPVYRAAWWSRHRESNRRWAAAMQEPLSQHGAQVLAYVTRVYQEPWMKDGYPVNVSAFSNWAGAYSTSFSLLVVSSMNAGNQGLPGFEITFHEAMHQWDDAMSARLRKVADANQIAKVNDLISHAIIFYTTGAALRSVVPTHTPYAELAGIWQRSLGSFKPALDSHWQAYLDGKTTMDEALLGLLKAYSQDAPAPKR